MIYSTLNTNSTKVRFLSQNFQIIILFPSVYDLIFSTFFVLSFYSLILNALQSTFFA